QRGVPALQLRGGHRDALPPPVDPGGPVRARSRGAVADAVATTPKAPLLVAGACAPLAFLTRQNGVALAAGLLAVLLFVNPRLGGASRRVREAAVFCAGFLVVSAPWFVYCRLQTGRFFVSQSYLVVAGGLLFRGESW